MNLNLTRFARTVAYMKMFIPEGTVISVRPNVQGGDEDREWIKTIKTMADRASIALVEFLNQPAHQIHLTKKCKISNKFRSTYDNIHKLPQELLPRLDTKHVVDHCTNEKYLLQTVATIRKGSSS